MKKLILIATALMIFGLAIIYFVFAFVQVSFDTSQWGEDARFLSGSMALAVLAIYWSGGVYLFIEKAVNRKS